MDKSKKLQQLIKARKESVALNRKSVQQEQQPFTNHDDAKSNPKRQEALELLRKREMEQQGLDVERMTNLSYSVEDVERWNEKQAIKDQQKQVGFSDYVEAAAKSYNKKIKELTPTIKSANTAHPSNAASLEDIAYEQLDHQPSEDAKEKVVQELMKQRKVNESRSKRRLPNDHDDVTYINKRNMHFNQKLSRTYDKYTKEIKESLERGTAL